MENFEKISSYVVSLISALLAYQFYDTISEHLFLRCWFYATLIIIACMVVTDIISLNNEAQGLKSFLRGIRYVCFFALAGCLLAGIYFRIEDNKVVITGKTDSNSSTNYEESTEEITVPTPIEQGSSYVTDILEDRSTISGVSAEEIEDSDVGAADDDSALELTGDLAGSDGFVTLSNGQWFYRIYSDYGYTATISNYSQRSIEINVKDAVTLELLEYIPYDQLEIESDSMGGDIGFYPIVFNFDMDTTSDIQKVASVTENDEPVADDFYYIIEPNEIRKLSMKISFKEAGLYRFRFSINYYKKGVKYTHDFPEDACIVEP